MQLHGFEIIVIIVIFSRILFEGTGTYHILCFAITIVVISFDVMCQRLPFGEIFLEPFSASRCKLLEFEENVFLCYNLNTCYTLNVTVSIAIVNSIRYSILTLSNPLKNVNTF